MNAERVHAIALKLRDDVQQEATLLSELTQALKKQVGAPAESALQQQVADSRNKLNAFLAKSTINSFSPAWRESLDEFNISYLLGDKLRLAIDKIFEANQVTPTVAHGEIKKFSEQVNALLEATTGLINGFEFYEIHDEELQPGECELGFLIPRKAVDNYLNELGEEFKDLNRILAPFSELAEGGRAPFSVRSISASDFGVYLTTSCVVAACFAKAVEWIINAYKGLLEIRKLRSDMVQRGIPAASLKDVDAYAGGIMEVAVNGATNELLERFGDNLEQGRRNELTIELKVSLNEIANRIDEGYNIEVRAEPPQVEDGQLTEDGDPNGKAQYFAIIGAAQESLKFIHQDGVPMLSLPTTVEAVTAAGTVPAHTEQAAETTEDTATPRKKRATKKRSAKQSNRKSAKG